MTANGAKPTLAVFKFASCDGCQLSVLDLEDELLVLADRVRIAYFLEASRDALDGPYDISLVEGSVTTPRDRERIHEVRAASKKLVTIGACATAGGVQALRNLRDAEAMRALVYARPEYVDTLATSTAIAANVPVDLEVYGCPIDKRQLLAVLVALLGGHTPRVASHSVCLDCKINGNVCVLVRGIPCLGPVTRTGCGALCPSYDRGCYGCFGPSPTANYPSMETALRAAGADDRTLELAYRTFNTASPGFDQAARLVQLRTKDGRTHG
jgi:coenzyme F420-reducing hydrogenase gamma subunit